MDKRVSEAIENVLAENTFAPDALKAMQAQLNAVKDTELELESAQRSADRKQATIDDQTARIEELEKRATQAVEMADKAAAQKIENAADKARADTLEKCFELVFRNAQVRRSVSSSVPVAEPYSDSTGNSYTNVNYHVQNEEITEETK